MAQATIRVQRLDQVLIATADSAQGHKNSIIIFNLVVTNKVRQDGGVGHIAERNRLCVAASRAQNAMMVVGDFEL